MKIAFRFLLLLIHLAINAIGLDYLGQIVSLSMNIVIVLIAGVLYSVLIVAFILHFINFLLFIKKQNYNL